MTHTTLTHNAHTHTHSKTHSTHTQCPVDEKWRQQQALQLVPCFTAPPPPHPPHQPMPTVTVSETQVKALQKRCVLRLDQSDKHTVKPYKLEEAEMALAWCVWLCVCVCVCVCLNWLLHHTQVWLLEMCFCCCLFVGVCVFVCVFCFSERESIYCLIEIRAEFNTCNGIFSTPKE